MLSLLIVLEDEEHRKLKQVKGDLSWHDFILRLLELKKIKRGNGNERKKYFL